MKVNGKYRYCLTWYSVEGEEMIGNEDLPKKVSVKTVQKWCSLEKDDLAVFCYPVTAIERRHLDKIVKHEIDLNKYAYFLECFQA